MNLKEIALSYADLHFAVFPLLPNEKRPATSNGYKAATTDREQITHWWTENPNYNIGIATGAPSGGLVVIDLDIDLEKGSDGISRLKQWQNQNGMQLPDETACARTGTGGLHLFFKDTNTSYRNSADIFKDGSGVDIRADGGYIVAPGSIHPNGTPYEWQVHPCIYGIAPVNHAVKSLLSLRGETRAKREEAPVTCSLIGEGARNDTLYRAACSMVAKGFSKDAITAAISAENEEKCVPPLAYNEVETIVASAYKHPNGTSAYTSKSNNATQNLGTNLVSLSEVEEKEPEWLIEGYIPRREITIIAGDGGTGKTFAWCSLAAAISSGYRSFLQNNLFSSAPERAAEKVLFFSSEDSYEYVLARRLRKSGADLRNIFTLDCTDDRFQAVTLNSDYLEQLLAEHRPALCIFDPIQAFIGGANMVSRSEMRECMKRLHAYGDKYGTTFVIIMHTNKMQNVWGRNRLSDSSDIWDIARSVLVIGKAGETGLRYLSHEKSNYGPQQQTVLYDIVDETVAFRGYTDRRDREYVLDASKNARDAPAADEAANFILSHLEEMGGSCTVGDLDNAARAFGISTNALRNAKEELRKIGKVKIDRASNGQGRGHKWVISRYPC